MSDYVLVVDDDPAILGAMAALFQARAVPCVTAANGQEALRAATGAPPRLIMIDLAMPEMDGPEVFQRLRASGVTSPTILMSATADDLSERAESLGFDGSVRKPFGLTEIFALADRFLPGDPI